MYAKVFAQIFDGTLCTTGPWQALVTFQQLLVLADQDGNVDMTPAAISRRTTIPLDIINTGIDALLLPDPDSRTPTEEGRRIVPLSDGRTWGWRVVNYKHYRSLKREEDRREYHREYWHKRKTQQTQQTQPSQPIAEAEAEAEAEKIEPTALVVEDAAYRVPNCPHQDLVAAYHEVLPMLPKVLVLSNMRMKHAQARWRQVCAEEKMALPAALDWFRWFFGKVAASKFLTGRSQSNGGRIWRADYEWLMNGSNFAKVVEGRYTE